MGGIKRPMRSDVNLLGCPAISGPRVRNQPTVASSSWIRALGLAAVLALLVPSPASAGPTCTIGGMPSIPFGAYDTISTAPTDVMGSFTYDCPPGQVVTVEFDRGRSGTFTYRTLVSSGGAATLRYNLFLDAARTVIWGDGTGGSKPGAFVTERSGKVTTAYVYARIFGGQDVPAGQYSDTIRVTIQF
jgi:spore coat protein U-like protein